MSRAGGRDCTSQFNDPATLHIGPRGEYPLRHAVAALFSAPSSEA